MAARMILAVALERAPPVLRHPSALKCHIPRASASVFRAEAIHPHKVALVDKNWLVCRVELDQRRARSVGVRRDGDREDAELTRNLAHRGAHKAVLTGNGRCTFLVAPATKRIDKSNFSVAVIVLERDGPQKRRQVGDGERMAVPSHLGE